MKVWEILKGIKNSLFKDKEIEKLAAERDKICKQCPHYDITGVGCVVPGSGPCCNKLTGGCGCSLYLKQRSPKSTCPFGKWPS